MKKLLTLIILTILIITSVSAASFVFDRDENTDISIPAFHNNRSKADSSVDCFLTLKYPNGSVLINDNQMTFNVSGHYNYTITNTMMDVLGEYPAAVRCDNDADFGFSTFTVLVTATGTELSTSNGIIYIIVFIISILLFFTSLIVTIKVKWFHGRDDMNNIVTINDLKWLKMVMGYITYLILIWIFFLAWGVTKNFLFLDGAARFFQLIFYTLISLALPIAGLTFVFVIIAVVEGKKLKRLMDRGLMIR